VETASIQAGELELEDVEWHTHSWTLVSEEGRDSRRDSHSVATSRVLGSTALHSNGMILAHREASHASSLQISTGSLNL